MIDINNFDAIEIGLASLQADPRAGPPARSPSRRRSTTARSSRRRTASSASASSVPPRTGSATAASTSASATRASSASAAASRSRAPRCAVSAWATSTSPPPSATSGSSRASRAASATCSTWLPRSSRRSCTSPRRSSRGSTRRRAGATSRSSRPRCRSELDRLRAEENERVGELRGSPRGPRRVPHDGQPERLRRRGPPVGRVAGHQRQEALRRGAREARQGARRRRSTSDIDDTEAYYEDARERLKDVWKLFANKDEPTDEPPAEGEDWPLSSYVEKPIEKDEFQPKTIIADETFFRELKHRFGSPFGFGEYFGGGMGAEHIRELLREKPEYDRDAHAAQGRRRPRRRATTCARRTSRASAWSTSATTSRTRSRTARARSRPARSSA